MWSRLLCCLLLASVASYTVGSLMAVDLGSEFLRVSLIKHGKTPISVVVNEMSKRKTPALVGFVNDERLMGEAAASVAARYPDAIYQRTRDLLGKFANESAVSQLMTDHWLPYSVTNATGRGTVGIATKDGTVYTAEELVASVLSYAKQITEAQAGGPVVDCVLTVPAYWGHFQRQALVDAAKLANLNVLALINTHAAAALQYGIERDFTNKTANVVLYEMGSGSTVAALVKYSSFEGKEAGKAKTYSQFEVKDVAWDERLGALQLDNVLVRHFAAQFNEKNKQASDLLSSPKSVAKLKKAVRRTKEVLSANSMAPCTVEEVHEGIDFFGSITREEFEALAGDFFARAVAPVRALLGRNGVGVEEISAFELLGGGSRVPRLQAALSEVLGGRNLDKHLDADEAVVLGAGLFAANLSAQFRLRKFGMTDTTQFGISFLLDEAHEAPGTEAPNPERNLLPYMKKLPSKRSVPFTNLTADPLRFSLQYNASTDHGLPPSMQDAKLASFKVTGVDEVIKKYNSSGDIRLRFEADWSGLLKLLKVESDVVVEVMEEKIIEVDADNTTNSATNSTDGVAADATDGKDTSKDGGKDGGKDTQGGSEDKASAGADGAGDGNATEAGGEKKEGEKKPPPKVIKRIQVPRLKHLKVPLTVAEDGWVLPPLGAEEQVAARLRLAALQEKERVKKENEKAKNELESYIIATRDDMDTNEEVAKVATEEVRSAFIKQLGEMEDWLYMEGDTETAAVYRKKLGELKKVGDPIYKRKDEADLRPAAVELARSTLDTMAKTVNSWPEMKPWIETEERKPVEEKLEAVQKWMEEAVKEQEGKALTEDPVFRVQELLNKLDAMERLFKKVNGKRKPKPPPAPPAAANTTANETADGGATKATAADADAKAGAEKAEKAGGEQDAPAGGKADEDIVHDEL